MKSVVGSSSDQIIFERLPGIEMVVSTEKKGKEYSTKASQSMDLVEKHVEIEIMSRVARITSILHFYNPSEKTLQGQLLFPLPAGSTLQGYGLDMDGRIVDAVPVSKDTARVAFEEIHQKKGQVSIAEKVDEFSNIFKCRVYPLNPKSKRIVKIVVLKTLQEDPNNRLLWYHCNHTKTLQKFSVKYKSSSSEKGKYFVLKDSNFEEISNLKKIGVKEHNTIEGLLFKLQKLEKMVLCEKDTESGDIYFSATMNIPKIQNNNEEEGEEEEEDAESQNVKTITIFYDISLSRKTHCDIQKENELLLQIIDQHSSRLKELEIITFSNGIRERRVFGGEEIVVSSQQISDFFESLVYDGGTDIPLERIGLCKSDVAILCSDGLFTFGKHIEQRLSNFSSNVPVHCVSSSKRVSYTLLDYISHKSGGKHFNLLKTTKKTDEIVGEILSGKKQLRVISIDYDPTQLKEVYHGQIENDYITVYGMVIGTERSSKISLNFDVSDLSGKVSCDIEMDHHHLSPISEGRLIGVLWANQKIRDLVICANKNKPKIEEIGLKFGIVSSES